MSMAIRRGGFDAMPTPLRVGVPKGPIQFFGDKDYEALYHASIDRLAALGASIVPIDYAPFAKAASMLYAGPWVAERLVAIGDLATRNPQAIHEVVRGIILGAKEMSAAETFKAFYDLGELIREARGTWAKADCLLLPTAGTTYTIAEMLAEALKLWLRTDPTVFVPLLPDDQVSVTLSSSLVLHSVGVESSWKRGVMAVEPCACSCG